MEDDNNDLMSMFDSGQELNLGFDYTNDDEDEDIDDESISNQDLVNNKNIKPIEEDNPESVDGEEDDDNEDNESDVDSSPNLYSSISNVLFEQGIMPSLESSDNIKTAEDFVNAFKKEIDVQTENRIEQRLASLDLDAIANSRRARMELDSIDEDFLKNNIETAKNIIYQDYLNQGLTEERASKMIRKISDLGEDIVLEDALEAVNSLKEYEKRIEEQTILNQKAQIAEMEKEQERINDTIKNTIYTSKEVITGIPNTKALQDKVFKSMTEPVAKNPNTGEMENKFMHTRSQNPIEFDAKMYYLFELTNGFTDLSAISRQASSKAVKNLEKVLRTTKFDDSGAPNYLQDPDSYSGGFGSELVL